MMTVHEVSTISGVSVRALHYYDHIGLLPATEISAAGYRLYDDTALERLQQILLFKELEFPLAQIRDILDSPDFDRTKALDQQIHLLKLRREHLQDLIDLACEIRAEGVHTMRFDAFDKSKMEAYAEEAKKTWGHTDAYREYQEKDRSRTAEDQRQLANGLMGILAEFGSMQALPADAPQVQAQVQKLQDYITASYYTCTDRILAGLGAMYAAGGEMTDNINACGGPGTAEYASQAIQEKVRG